MRLRQARKEAGLSQRDLGNAIRLSDKAVSTYEVDRATPSLETLKDISRVTRKPLLYFLDEADPDDLELQIKLRNIEQELLEVKQLLKKRNAAFPNAPELVSVSGGSISESSQEYEIRDEADPVDDFEAEAEDEEDEDESTLTPPQTEDPSATITTLD